ncbi:MAG: UDP-N-acetylglucosamine 1-carboxyvinyltransferase [Candidatus Marinimicrobia bacterium]|nr:UDP-N-acetylglucosamine 1-carboxyvinyltransferase [Candidatus Neomarinimicrobiota bacterium]
MDKIIIRGGKPLFGEVNIGGAKNAVLPIMAATVISPGHYNLTNVPNLRDTRTMAELLRVIGAKVEYNNHKMEIDSTTCNNPVAPYDLVKTMRASFDILGALISRFGYAEVSMPGGCAWGPRPVNYHIDALKKLGAHLNLDHGNIIASGKLTGNEIKFKFPSVGATKNALMAAVKANGKTIIRNAAREPEIDTLVDFLNLLGAVITGKSTSTLMIEGVNALDDNLDFEIIPDRIEAGTFLIAAALIGGEITLTGVNPNHLSAVINKLKASGTEVIIFENKIKVCASKEIKAVDMTTAPYPEFPTDLQAQWMALMTKCTSSVTIIDEVYFDRFTHVAELSRLGANIKLERNVATVTGIDTLIGAPVMSTDIRASASLILACLAADGESEISRVYHIDRGYENIEKKFQKLGADINRISN